ncbi:hypothetical protein PC120_g15341 [Phytophthora cactorum]|nr:hypothetical protein PC120_g15341 [Phytophthora cactorum]
MGLPIETRLSGQSYWATAAGTKTGVAIPIDPYGANKDVRPILEDAWNENFIAVEGKVNGTRLILMSVYGPHQPGRRELFFDRLAGLEVPLDGLVALGGDFNSTLDAQTDRSYSTDRPRYADTGATRRKLRRPTKQKLRRLARHERRLLEDQAGNEATVDNITDILDGVPLDDV